MFVWKYDRVAEHFWSHKVTSKKLLGARPCSLHSSLCLFHWIYNHPSFVATEQKPVLCKELTAKLKMGVDTSVHICNQERPAKPFPCIDCAAQVPPGICFKCLGSV